MQFKNSVVCSFVNVNVNVKCKFLENEENEENECNRENSNKIVI